MHPSGLIHTISNIYIYIYIYIYIQFEVNFSSSFTISYLEKYTFQALIVEVFEASIMQ
jgi:prolipoprotein diacylglyceryltransferase